MFCHWCFGCCGHSTSSKHFQHEETLGESCENLLSPDEISSETLHHQQPYRQNTPHGLNSTPKLSWSESKPGEKQYSAHHKSSSVSNSSSSAVKIAPILTAPDIYDEFASSFDGMKGDCDKDLASSLGESRLSISSNYGEQMCSLAKIYREQFGESWLVVYNQYVSDADKGPLNTNHNSISRKFVSKAFPSEGSELDDYFDSPNNSFSAEKKWISFSAKFPPLEGPSFHSPHSSSEVDLSKSFTTPRPLSIPPRKTKSSKSRRKKKRSPTHVIDFDKYGAQRVIKTNKSTVPPLSFPKGRKKSSQGSFPLLDKLTFTGSSSAAVDTDSIFLSKKKSLSLRTFSLPCPLTKMGGKTGNLKEDDKSCADLSGFQRMAIKSEPKQARILSTASSDQISPNLSLDGFQPSRSDAPIIFISNAATYAEFPESCVCEKPSSSSFSPLTPPLSGKSTCPSTPASPKSCAYCKAPRSHECSLSEKVVSPTSRRDICVHSKHRKIRENAWIPHPRCLTAPIEESMIADLTSVDVNPDHNIMLNFVLHIFEDHETFQFLCQTRYISSEESQSEMGVYLLMTSSNIYLLKIFEHEKLEEITQPHRKFSLSKLKTVSFGMFYQNFTWELNSGAIYTFFTRDQDLTQVIMDHLMASLSQFQHRPLIRDEETSCTEVFDTLVRSCHNIIDLTDIQTYQTCFLYEKANDSHFTHSISDCNSMDPKSPNGLNPDVTLGQPSSVGSFSYDVPAQLNPDEFIRKEGFISVLGSFLMVSYWKTHYAKLMGSHLRIYASQGDQFPKISIHLIDAEFIFSDGEAAHGPYVFEVSTSETKTSFSVESKADYVHWKLLFTLICGQDQNRYMIFQSPILFQGNPSWCLLLFSDVILLARTHSHFDKWFVMYIFPLSESSVKMSSHHKRLLVHFQGNSFEIEFFTAEDKGVCFAEILQVKALGLHEEKNVDKSLSVIECEIEQVEITLNHLRLQCADDAIYGEARERLKKQISYLSQKIEELNMQYVNKTEHSKGNSSQGSPTSTLADSFLSPSWNIFKKPTQTNYIYRAGISYCSLVVTADCLYLCREDHRWRLKLDVEHSYDCIGVYRVQDLEEIHLATKHPHMITLVFGGGPPSPSNDASELFPSSRKDIWQISIFSETERLRFLTCLKTSWKSLFKVDLSILVD